MENWFGLGHYQFLRLCLESVGFVTICYWLFVGVVTCATRIGIADRPTGVSVGESLKKSADMLQDKQLAIELMAAASRSGDEGAIRLAAQLADVAPCEKCGFIRSHCRCDPASCSATGKEKHDQQTD